MGSVYLRLRKRHPDDKCADIMQAGEVAKDLGLEAIVEAAQDLALDYSKDEEDSDQSRKSQGLQAVKRYLFLTQNTGKAPGSTHQERCGETHVIQTTRLHQKEL